MPLDNVSTNEFHAPRAPRATSPDLEPVHQSAVMRALDDAIARVAASAAPVVLLGEVGTGKARVARAIHARGPRRGAPFVAASTPGIAEPLLESELLGHVRGAFNDATQERRGLLAEAEGGTLLLGELADVPLALQARLLAVLRAGEVRPLGSDRARPVDVRLIVASHHDLEALARDGLLRQDLRYRLDVVTLVVPPLRDRREDIPALARHFLAAARRRTPTSPVEAIDDEAMALLSRAAWPGNVRELKSTIERLVVLGSTAAVRAQDLEFLEAGRGRPWPMTTGGLCTLREMNQRYLDWVLTQTGGNKERAAKILGIDLSTLYRWRRSGKYKTD